MKPDFDLFEKENKIVVPLQLKFLFYYFDFSSLLMEYYDPKEDWIFRLTKWIEFSKDRSSKILIDTFIDRIKLTEIWTRHLELWGEATYLPIAYTISPINGIIVYNINNNCIYISSDGSREATYIASDSVTFINACVPVLRDSKNINTSQLYRNWGEDFWRVRENGQDSSSSEHSVK